VTRARGILVWTMIAVLAALVAYFSFRGYMSADMLFNFGNSFLC
jgi:hypothetical protein